MPRYFFDCRDCPELIRDQEGIELRDLNEVRNEATRGLADLSKDVIPGSERRELAIEVRDAHNHPLLRAALSFEVAVLA
jgi:hypothetical protein